MLVHLEGRPFVTNHVLEHRAVWISGSMIGRSKVDDGAVAVILDLHQSPVKKHVPDVLAALDLCTSLGICGVLRLLLGPEAGRGKDVSDPASLRLVLLELAVCLFPHLLIAGLAVVGELGLNQAEKALVILAGRRILKCWFCVERGMVWYKSLVARRES